MAFDTPAVVVGAGINGLGVARSLKQARVPVWLLDTNATRPEMRTRAARALAIRSLHGEGLIEELVRLGSGRLSGKRPVLFLTQEEGVKEVSRLRDRLSALYRLSLPPAHIVDALQHKHGFQRLAEASGAPIPKLVHVRTASDLATIETLRYPVVVKPGTRNAGYSRQFKKAYHVEHAADATGLIGRILPVLPDVVVQEWIDGPDTNIYFCLQAIDRAGLPLASFTGRKVRSWPPGVGGTASCVPAPDARVELTDLTTRFFRDVGVIGLASMEYKRDARNGEFRMVEPTIGRTDYQEEVAALNGTNLAFAAYCCELGVPFPATRPPRCPVAWRVRSEDLQSAAAQHQRPREGFAADVRVVDALWRRSDPVPWLARNLQRLQRVLRSRILKHPPDSRPARSRP